MLLDEMSLNLDSNSAGVADVEDETPLPEEIRPIENTKVPFLLQDNTGKHNDFIIIAEFSEIEGPTPIATIPEDLPKWAKNISLSNLAVHLMCTDYQVNTVGHFQISEDTQVLRKNVFQGIHVFMHYFTLFDLKARGFVRPFCFGYVSCDHVKLEYFTSFFVTEFHEISQTLKHSNRQWFKLELSEYLGKLRAAKEKWLYNSKLAQVDDFNIDQEFVDQDISDSQSCSSNEETVTLSQIAHQFSEIENVLRLIDIELSKPYENELLDLMKTGLKSHPQKDVVNFLKNNDIHIDLNISVIGRKNIDFPLVHPLKAKGEKLRPLTTLSQFGAVYLLYRLHQCYLKLQKDLIFHYINEFSAKLRQNMSESLNSDQQEQDKENPEVLKGSDRKLNRQSQSSPESEGNTSHRSIDSLSSSGSRFAEFSELSEISVRSNGTDVSHSESPDSKCDLSYFFTEEFQSVVLAIETGAYSVIDSFDQTSVDSFQTVSEDLLIISSSNPELKSRLLDGDTQGSKDIKNQDKTSWNSALSYGTAQNAGVVSILSESSDPSNITSVTSRSSESDLCTEHVTASAEEIISKMSWLSYIEKGHVSKHRPGYGMASFFKKYRSMASHILYSILIGRTVIFCGEQCEKKKISKTITSLIPLVPCVSKEWRLLRWHQGILVKSHFRKYKLIGLCIPERLNAHDLLNIWDQNLVTMVNLRKRTINGPSYSGKLFKQLESTLSNSSFSDQMCLCLLGDLFCHLETKAFMMKSLMEQNPKKGNAAIAKELEITGCDSEIIRFLSNLTLSVNDFTGIF